MRLLLMRAPDFRAKLCQFFLDPLVATIQMIDAIDGRLALCNKAGNNQTS